MSYRLRRKVSETRAAQIECVARFTLELLEFPWNYELDAATWSEVDAGQQRFRLLHERASQCAELGMAGPALSVWLDIAPDSVPYPDALTAAASER